MPIDKDSFITGLFLGLIWFIPPLITAELTNIVLSGAVLVTIAAGIATLIIALLFSVLAVPLSDKITELLVKRSLKLVSVIGKDDRIVLFSLIAIGDVFSVLAPVLVLVFVL